MTLGRALVFLLCCLPAWAAAEIEFEASPSTLSHHQLKFGGYLYGSYNYLVRSHYFTSGFYDRGNDIAENGLRLQQTYLALSSFDKGLGGLLVTLIGQDAYYQAPAGFNADVFGSNTVGLTFPEAYLQYRADAYTIKVGLISALAGYESYDYRQNDHFSYSLLDQFAEPGTHVGVRLIRRLNNQFGLIAGLANGWNTVVNPQNLSSFILGLNYNKNDIVNVMLDGYLGPSYLTEHGNHGMQGMRRLLQLYGVFKIAAPLQLAFSTDYGMQTKAALPARTNGRATWSGVVGYLTYLWSDKATIALRGEVFDDGDGYRTGVRQCLEEATLTFSYRPVKPVLVTAETRHDFSNKNTYQYLAGTGVNQNQQSYALTLFYQFA